MYYVFCFFVGIIVGAACLLLIVMDRLSRAKKKVAAAEEQRRRAQEAIDAARAKEARVTEQSAQFHQTMASRERELQKRSADLESRKSALDAAVISYDELNRENLNLKRDLQNIDVSLNKVVMEGEDRDAKQADIDRRSNELSRRYLADTVKAVSSSISSNNFSSCKQKLIDVINRCRAIGYTVSEAEEAALLDDLKLLFEKAVRAEYAREEQARIKAKIREEERLQREIDRELAQFEREKIAIQAALDRALAEAQDRHSEEVDRLRTRLAEAEEKSRRAISMAQQTKAGNVYVISNIGSFGKDVFKIGMTRRLEPKDRVKELCGASVPFPFDVHMMIASKDAPALEYALHKAFHKNRVNKVNPRKEFFRAEAEKIHEIVKQHCGEVLFTADAEALEYNQSLTMTVEDQEFIENLYEQLEEDDENAVVE